MTAPVSNPINSDCVLTRIFKLAWSCIFIYSCCSSECLIAISWTVNNILPNSSPEIWNLTLCEVTLLRQTCDPQLISLSTGSNSNYLNHVLM